MRRGRRGRIMRMAMPAAERGRRLGRAAHGQCQEEPSVLLLPGRSLFGRQAGNYRHQPRCGMCRPGRHRGHGGKKALKKVGAGGHQARARWLEVVRESAEATGRMKSGACTSGREVGVVLSMVLSRWPVLSGCQAPPSAAPSGALRALEV